MIPFYDCYSSTIYKITCPLLCCTTGLRVHPGSCQLPAPFAESQSNIAMSHSNTCFVQFMLLISG